MVASIRVSWTISPVLFCRKSFRSRRYSSPRCRAAATSGDPPACCSYAHRPSRTLVGLQTMGGQIHSQLRNSMLLSAVLPDSLDRATNQVRSGIQSEVAQKLKGRKDGYLGLFFGLLVPPQLAGRKHAPPAHWPSSPWIASNLAPQPWVSIPGRSAGTTSCGVSTRSRRTCHRVAGSETRTQSSVVIGF